MPEERRKSKRFKVKDGSFACITSKSRKVGAILDISTDGVAFKYMADERWHGPVSGPSELEIFNREGNFHLKGISLEPSSDVPLAGPHFLPSALMRRLGGRFQGITADQWAQLGQFIQKFAT